MPTERKPPKIFHGVAFVDGDRRGREFRGRTMAEVVSKIRAWRERRGEGVTRG